MRVSYFIKNKNRLRYRVDRENDERVSHIKIITLYIFICDKSDSSAARLVSCQNKINSGGTTLLLDSSRRLTLCVRLFRHAAAGFGRRSVGL